jgi:hypothetical protein
MWRRAGCCGGQDAQVKQIKVDGVPVGLAGLDTIFEQLYVLGKRPEGAVADEPLAMVEARNYVPRSAEEEYKQALLGEFASFCAVKPQ